jgi:hypothetical protein
MRASAIAGIGPFDSRIWDQCMKCLGSYPATKHEP